MGYTDKIEKALDSMSDLMCELATDVQRTDNSDPEEVARHLAKHMTHSDEARIASYVNVDASKVAGNVDITEVAANLDNYDIANNINYSSLAYEIDLGEIADRIEIDACDVAEQFSVSEIASEIDASDVALELDVSEITEEVAKDVVQIVTKDDVFLNRLAQMIIESFAKAQVDDMQRELNQANRSHDALNAELKLMKQELTALRKAAVNQINKPTTPQPETSTTNE